MKVDVHLPLDTIHEGDETDQGEQNNDVKFRREPRKTMTTKNVKDFIEDDGEDKLQDVIDIDEFLESGSDSGSKYSKNTYNSSMNLSAMTPGMISSPAIVSSPGIKNYGFSQSVA